MTNIPYKKKKLEFTYSFLIILEEKKMLLKSNAPRQIFGALIPRTKRYNIIGEESQ